MRLEAHIKDLRKTNAQLKDQYQKLYLDSNKHAQETDKLKEELARLKANASISSQNLQALLSQKTDLEKELRDTRDYLQRRLSSMEEELNDLKTAKLPEKEKELEELKKNADDFSNRVADLNREKVNAWREYRLLGEKYLKLQDSEAKLKEQIKNAHKELELSQNQLVSYQKTITALERNNKLLKQGPAKASPKTEQPPLSDVMSYHSISSKYSSDNHSAIQHMASQPNN